MKLLIVGGVAAGASCAARARRLSEEAEIIIFERGPFVSFANCGLPYHVGNIIPEEKSLLIATPETFRERFNISVRLESEVLSIDRDRRLIEVKELASGRVYKESYDALVLAPGAQPIRPPLKGADLPGIFVLRSIPDTRKIKSWISEKKARKAVIVGGGFIGVEMAENLAHAGIAVTLLEMQTQVLPPFDPEMVAPVQDHLQSKKVHLVLGDALAGFEPRPDGGLSVLSQSGRKIETDLVILAIGVKPESRLAKDAGLEIGARGGIRVNPHLQTSDPRIWAAGDAVEVNDFVTETPVTVPLAGPANRQGRIAAENIFGCPTVFRGAQGSAVCKIFDFTAAMTGPSEKILRRLGVPFEKVYLHTAQHAGYYPGSEALEMKLLFSPDTGRILGAQAAGKEGVEKRIDVLAMAIQMKATVFDLEESELCYAPQFGSAKDPVNILGMIAANSIRRDAPLKQWDDSDLKGAFLLDVRTPEEYRESHVEGAVNIPLTRLRDDAGRLPRDRNIYVYCGVGQRAYNATRLLRMRGLNAYNLSGGIKTYRRLSPRLG
jgi:NADPH-dependent 2,4-dienoyl-CoA reductase/sulfur reductase-like enzyme/rhodanese-related sulfurtransferase